MLWLKVSWIQELDTKARLLLLFAHQLVAGQVEGLCLWESSQQLSFGRKAAALGCHTRQMLGEQ